MTLNELLHQVGSFPFLATVNEIIGGETHEYTYYIVGTMSDGQFVGETLESTLIKLKSDRRGWELSTVPASQWQREVLFKRSSIET